MQWWTILSCAASVGPTSGSGEDPEVDTFETDGDVLRITFLGHGTLMLEYNRLCIHVDPVSSEADYANLPPADLILITHHHHDHLDKEAVAQIHKNTTIIVLTEQASQDLLGGISMQNGTSCSMIGVEIEAVPAYNTTPDRTGYHPQGRDNGYVLTLGALRVYIAGDTEDIPEMRALKDIDIAFLPMNLPYTMAPQQVAAAAKAFRPKVLYPYHYGETDPSELVKLLQSEKDIEVRVRSLK